MNLPVELSWLLKSLTIAGAWLTKVDVCRIRGGAILAIKPIKANTTIKYEIEVAKLLLPRIFPGKCSLSQCTGAFRASAKKNAVKINVRACDALIAA